MGDELIPQSQSQRLRTLATARRVLQEESDGISKLSGSVGAPFVLLVDRILAATGSTSSQGKVLVTGLGKSGLVAMKVAATLTSTGTQAIFLHPLEALHGDIGITDRGDICLAFSKSGSPEVVRFVQHASRLGAAVAAVTVPSPGNPLCDEADPVVPLPDLPEACPLGLAPMTSTTLMLALGDALAASLLEARGFAPSDFARFHPDGSLGRRLLLRVRDLMHAGNALPAVSESVGFLELVAEMSAKRLGIVCVTAEDGTLIGVLTDGDLRRLIERCRADLQSLSPTEALERSARIPGQRRFSATVAPDVMAVHCRNLMDADMISSLVVVDPAQRPVGVIRLHDLVHAGL